MQRKKKPVKKAKRGKKKKVREGTTRLKKRFAFKPWYREFLEKALERGVPPEIIDTRKDAEKMAKSLGLEPETAISIIGADIKFFQARLKEKKPKWMAKADILKLVSRVRWREKVKKEFELTEEMADLIINLDIELFTHRQRWWPLKKWRELAARMKEIKPIIEAQKAAENVEIKAYTRDVRSSLFLGKPMTEKELVKFIRQEKKRPKKETGIVFKRP
jgi:hypothetical protein